nr:seed biotin-containing protein SBP65 [Ipomoea batatas]GMD86314.1 seed biotin-containing protein SBP65 [Ipomoea batatas]GME08416.1 seed biotin-containing protein SBP65 [Ipomoea batatas]GME13340.1 seed biotin-containing protein SBP65 [Ipomoea batatas]GME15242.1 seed biotin-containing protein SBP65 [Ipomoea batatas]
MASEQVRRDNVTNLREIRGQGGEEKVSNKTADRRHGTSAEKIHGGSFATDVHGLPAGTIRVTGTNNTSGTQQRRSQGHQPGEQKKNNQENWPSLEESGLHSGAAKQNTAEALRAAEERYEKAKERERQALDEAAEKARKAAETSSQYAARKREEAERERNAGGGEGPRDIHGGVKAEEGGGGVLGAIGETIVEIGKTAQDLVGGRGRSK